MVWWWCGGVEVWWCGVCMVVWWCGGVSDTNRYNLPEVYKDNDRGRRSQSKRSETGAITWGPFCVTVVDKSQMFHIPFAIEPHSSRALVAIGRRIRAEVSRDRVRAGVFRGV